MTFREAENRLLGPSDEGQVVRYARYYRTREAWYWSWQPSAPEFDDQFVGGRHANLGRLVR
jgi:hypothetical protein